MPRFARFREPARFGRRGDADAFEVPVTETLRVLESEKEIRNATPDEYRYGLLRGRLNAAKREQPPRPHVVILVRGLTVFEYVDRLEVSP